MSHAQSIFSGSCATENQVGMAIDEPWGDDFASRIEHPGSVQIYFNGYLLGWANGQNIFPGDGDGATGQPAQEVPVSWLASQNFGRSTDK